MAGCKRCALKGGNRERDRKRKEKEKGGKNGDQNRVVFFISPCACFFICAVVIFQIYIRKTVSRLSRSYPVLFAIKMFMVSQFGDL